MLRRVTCAMLHRVTCAMLHRVTCTMLHSYIAPISVPCQLEHECLQSQSEVMRLQKDMIKMRDKLEKRDNEILELNTVVSALKEDLAKTSVK